VARERRIWRYPRSFREMAVKQMKESKNITALARELRVPRSLLYKWHGQLEPVDDGNGLQTNLVERDLRKEVAELKRLLGEKTLELDFFRGALQKVEARRRSGEGSGGKASTTKSGE